MLTKRTLDLIATPLRSNNPVTVQTLGICSALAVTTSLQTALTMCFALTAVLCLSSVIISVLRQHIPSSTRLIIQITIIASLVIIVDLFLKAFLFDISQRLSVFVSLIVTNCLVLGRAEAFAMKNPVRASLLDGFGNSMGYSLVLLIVATTREFLGTGQLFGYPVLTLIDDGGWFEPLDFMLKAPSAFFIIGLLVWAGHKRKAETPAAEEQHQTIVVINKGGASHD
jgi:Na+-transporting NADH:ubiquinone oxidoreductase subunit D